MFKLDGGEIKEGEVFNTVTIDLAALRGNLQEIQGQIGSGVKLMAVVKSDAYGHGLERCALALAQAGTSCFGVAEVEEGVRLRQAGIDGEIVVLLGPGFGEDDTIIEYDLTPAVFDLKRLTGLSNLAAQMDRKVSVHLKVDTGMGRLGIMPEDVGAFVQHLTALPGIILTGVLSHFPLADANPTQTLEQCRRFQEIVDQVPALAQKTVRRHIANSAAILLSPETHLDMVRPGITLYGCHSITDSALRKQLKILPVMRFSTRIVQVKEVPEGYGLSYGHMHVTRKPSRLALLPVGYDDGYMRGLSGKAMVLIDGKRVPLLGRVCMNLCIADISDLQGVKPGDEAVLFGRQGNAEITVDEVADWLDTISYEILCLVGGRNKRRYINVNDPQEGDE